MRYKQIFDFLRIDIDAARDDHEALTVGEIKEILLIDPADIAQRCPAMFIGRFGGLLRIVMIFELRTTFEKYPAFSPRRDFIAVFVTDVDDTEQRPSDRALVSQPNRYT